MKLVFIIIHNLKNGAMRKIFVQYLQNKGKVKREKLHVKAKILICFFNVSCLQVDIVT